MSRGRRRTALENPFGAFSEPVIRLVEQHREALAQIESVGLSEEDEKEAREELACRLKEQIRALRERRHERLTPGTDLQTEEGIAESADVP